jgi:hypothetical protein
MTPASVKRAAAWTYLHHLAPQASDEQVQDWAYLADLRHLHQWGRLIAEAPYAAEAQGPVWSEGVPPLLPVEDALLHLSHSDRSGLRAVWEAVGHEPLPVLRQRVQDAAWSASWHQAPHTPISVEALAELSDDPGPLLAHLRDPHPGEAPPRS